ncbi:trypsin-like peptidase domain-containing protein [Candidatus Woesearchaeota archaeon]|nr:trypsin-like peptidase domain-containing protein [Candidatus Woesearchaeota archaeon]
MEITRRQFIQLATIEAINSSLTICEGYIKNVLEKIEEENEIRKVKNIQEVIDSYVTLKRTAYFKEGGEVPGAQREGIGIPYGNYILTLKHMTDINQIGMLRVDALNIQGRIVKGKVQLDGQDLEELVMGEEVVIFKLPETYNGKKFPFKLGDSDTLKDGQEIIVIGYPDRERFYHRDGIVTKPSDGKVFYISTKLFPGDSGTAVVDKETFELLGQAFKAKKNGENQAIPINLFTDQLTKIHQ